MAYEINYSVVKGEVWERLIIPKDRRTRRKRVPTQAAASIRIVTNNVPVDYVIPTEITSEGGVLLSMTPAQTKWLPVGEHDWDMVVTVSRSALLTSTPLAQTLLIQGTITVTAQDNITPMDSDSLSEALELVT